MKKGLSLLAVGATLALGGVAFGADTESATFDLSNYIVVGTQETFGTLTLPAGAIVKDVTWHINYQGGAAVGSGSWASELMVELISPWGTANPVNITGAGDPPGAWAGNVSGGVLQDYNPGTFAWGRNPLSFAAEATLGSVANSWGWTVPTGSTAIIDDSGALSTATPQTGPPNWFVSEDLTGSDGGGEWTLRIFDTFGDSPAQGMFFDGSHITITYQGTPNNCPADLNGDGVVDGGDLLILLAAWGPNPGHPADLNGDGTVDGGDLLILLAAWGPCPPKGECDTPFVCGNPVPWCDDEQTCACLAQFNGETICATNWMCTGITCPTGSCPAGHVCVVDSCCGETTCMPVEGICGDEPPVCDEGFVCGGDITWCNEEEFCVCFFTFTGGIHCLYAGVDCGQECPTGSCPAGQICLTDTCCNGGQPTCVEEVPCEPVDPLCNVGFECGGTLSNCEGFDGTTCYCWNGYGGGFACGDGNVLCDEIPTCPTGSCPPGWVCAVDTCCNEPVCLPACDQSENECATPGTCGNYTQCGTGSPFDCLCWEIDGNPDLGMCFQDFFCSDAFVCPPEGCPPGYACVTDSCCGAAYCGPIVKCDENIAAETLPDKTGLTGSGAFRVGSDAFEGQPADRTKDVSITQTGLGSNPASPSVKPQRRSPTGMRPGGQIEN